MKEKKKKIARPSFEEFLSVFPEVSLPVTLTESLHHELAKANVAMPQILRDTFIKNADKGFSDEYTEYIPGFKVTVPKQFTAVVFWKAGLMAYEYILATYSPKGELITSEVISKMEIKNGKLIRNATVITEDFVIYVAEGDSDVELDELDAGQIVNYSYEVLPSGEIVKYGQEEFLR